MNIKDIAKLAGVSKSTVSRVINHSETVNEAMRNRVLKVIEETGYRPNALAKELVIKETRLIGVIIPRINTNVFSDIVEGITSYLSNHGYNVILLCSQADEATEIKQFEFLEKKQVDGIIFFPGNMTTHLKNQINKLRTPLVLLGLDQPDLHKSVVTYDEYHASFAMIENFIDKGHQSVGFIGIDPTKSPVGEARKKGYYDALTAHELSASEDYVYLGSFDFKTGYDGAKKLFENNQSTPTAIFAATDYIAMGALKFLREINRNDVAVAGFDDLEISKYFSPSLTSIRFDYQKSGAIAAQFVLENLKTPEIIKKQILGFQIIERESSNRTM